MTEALPGFPIVLHGGSGIPDEQIKQLSNLVLQKLTLTLNAKSHSLTQLVNLLVTTKQTKQNTTKKKLFDPRKFLADGVKAIQASVEERIDVFGSEGKA